MYPIIQILVSLHNFKEISTMKKERILVVDDEKDILELVRFNLDRERYSVICTTSGREALNIARKEYPDLIVLDLMLPDIDGLEVARILKGDPKTKNIHIVMLTAKGEEPDIVTGLEFGADEMTMLLSHLAPGS